MMYRINRLPIAALLAVLLSACTNDANTYYLLTDTAKGLEPGSEVYFNGIQVGEIDDMGFTGQKVKLTLDIRKDVKIGKKSTFHYLQTGLFEKSLEIRGKNDTQFYKPRATIYYNLEYKYGPLGQIMTAMDSVDKALKAGDIELTKIGDYKNGKKNYGVYRYFYKEDNSSVFDSESHVVFLSEGDTIAYTFESEYALPVKFDGTYFYCDDSPSRYKFNGFDEVLCVKDGCFEQAYPDFSPFREGLQK